MWPAPGLSWLVKYKRRNYTLRYTVTKLHPHRAGLLQQGRRFEPSGYPKASAKQRRIAPGIASGPAEVHCGTGTPSRILREKSGSELSARSLMCERSRIVTNGSLVSSPPWS